jgi:hypothetical protein
MSSMVVEACFSRRVDSIKNYIFQLEKQTIGLILNGV